MVSVSNWTANDVASWLGGLGLQHADIPITFREQGFDGLILVYFWNMYRHNWVHARMEFRHWGVRFGDSVILRNGFLRLFEQPENYALAVTAQPPIILSADGNLQAEVEALRQELDVLKRNVRVIR